MRKIKFRAKMTGFQGNVFGTPGNVYEDKDYKHEWFDSIFFQDENGNKCQEYIDCHTLSQFTGKSDKKGVEIYEHDILKTGMGYGVVVFDNHYLAFMIDFKQHSEKKYFEGFLKFEVAGNIFDNPELINV